jgi:opacity protein-like surface antigen
LARSGQSQDQVADLPIVAELNTTNKSAGINCTAGTIADGAGHSTPFSFGKTSVVWTVGGGVEGQLWDRWTWKVEYLFLELDEPGSSGGVQTSIPCFVVGRIGCGATPITAEIDPRFKDNIARLGINYKFN